MNNIRRRRVYKAKVQLGVLIDEVNDILLEEEIAFDGLPEGFQNTPNGMDMQDNIDALDECKGQLTAALKKLEDVI